MREEFVILEDLRPKKERDLPKLLPLCYALSKQMEALGVLLDEVRRLPPPLRTLPASRVLPDLENAAQCLAAIRASVDFMAEGE